MSKTMPFDAQICRNIPKIMLFDAQICRNMSNLEAKIKGKWFKNGFLEMLSRGRQECFQNLIFGSLFIDF